MIRKVPPKPPGELPRSKAHVPKRGGRQKGTPKNKPTAVAANQPRELLALRLHVAGVPLRDVGARLAQQEGRPEPYSATTIHGMIQRQLARERAPLVMQHRELEALRYDELQNRFWARALGQPARPDPSNPKKILPAEPPDPAAAKVVLQVMKQRAALLGLDQYEGLKLGELVERLLDIARDLTTPEQYAAFIDRVAGLQGAGAPGAAQAGGGYPAPDAGGLAN